MDFFQLDNPKVQLLSPLNLPVKPKKMPSVLQQILSV